MKSWSLYLDLLILICLFSIQVGERSGNKNISSKKEVKRERRKGLRMQL